MSATSIRNSSKTFDSPDRPPLRDTQNSRDRFNFRDKTGDGDNDRARDGRNNLLRPKRAEGDADSDGWSTVKPRKSFGTEGAERFNGRMGVDKHRDDRRFKDREERDAKDKPQRGFDTFSREKDGDYDQERENRRNGTGRGKGESWFRDSDGPPTPRDRNSNGDRLVDRSRGWREKERDDREDRGGKHERGDRRWDRDRDQRQEREPEWMDEPADEKKMAHTQEDFQKWKESMQREDKPQGNKPLVEESKGDLSGQASFFGLEKPKVETPLGIDTGPDKFFGMWATPKEEITPESGIEVKKEGAVKAKTTGKASRFTSFFTPQEEPPRRQTEPPPPMPPPAANGLSALFPSTTPGQEKEAFQNILLKLQSQSRGSGTTPPANAQQQPKPPAPEKQHSNPTPTQELFQQYRSERQDEQPSASQRNSQQALQDLLNQRQVAGSQPTVRPDNMVQELIGQRQNALSQSSNRPDQDRNNSQFLMELLKSQPPPQRTEAMLLRMPQSQKPADRQMQQQMIEREQEMQREAARERNASQRARPQPPPGFYDDPSFQRGPPQHERHAGNPPQPTQILQRPPPPGLDQMQPGWAQPPSQLPPPQQQVRQQHNIAPPPGLAGGPPRAMPMPQMFPTPFPGMGNFPPPDVMGGPPRMQPPPGFFNAPPPGFLPPGMSMAFGAPFDGRGPPPNGAFRRP